MSWRKGGRSINSHERALWNKVVENATPLSTRPSMTTAAKPIAVPELGSNAKSETRLPDDFAIGARPRASSEIGAALSTPGPVPRMDHKTHMKMRRGKLSPEARIDLHGMTADRAHGALIEFIFNQHARGKRLVLVITGKGRERDAPGPIPGRTGILRQQVPRWLQSAALAPLVLDVTSAHQRHGGSGAYYVYLRRPR